MVKASEKLAGSKAEPSTVTASDPPRLTFCVEDTGPWMGCAWAYFALPLPSFLMIVKEDVKSAVEEVVHRFVFRGGVVVMLMWASLVRVADEDVVKSGRMSFGMQSDALSEAELSVVFRLRILSRASLAVRVELEGRMRIRVLKKAVFVLSVASEGRVHILLGGPIMLM
jgi:hypothetical protein